MDKDKDKENNTETPSFEIVVNGRGSQCDTPEKAKVREKAFGECYAEIRLFAKGRNA